MTPPLSGIVAAVFTPLQADGSLDLDRVGPIADKLIAEGVDGLFPCGSTGEGTSLAGDERMAVAKAYVDAAAGRVPVAIHVGHCSLVEARRLAAHAAGIGAAAVAACPPWYFKPAGVASLVDCMAQVAAGAPELPFYYYHIPAMTGVAVDMSEFLPRAAERIPNLVGLKFTAPAVDEFQALVTLEGGRFSVLYGRDEMLLAGLTAGAKGFIGSTYNFAAPLYRRLIDAFRRGDLDAARQDQAKAVAMIHVVLRHGGLTGLKAMMSLTGRDCGPPRLPLVAISTEQLAQLRRDLERVGFPVPPRAT